ncbi:cucumber peeling cupredoxin [Lactuca sativa]|uniref:Phytocyanin domain-containing protein n=1 Tax=Lactuca sativa TaxID=4236 RepID=A0A9R1V347_LACSA|nr:cucumber peeling cupredoxin [Lactuca sativa]KAJ0197396.1 hypothetical protein LSAT_V11C700360120 [Lactuca sativa]
MQDFNPNLVVLIVMMIATMQFQVTMAQKRHVVGDGLGWTVPSGGAVAYTTWASLQTFNVGDLLVFTFTDGEHDVAEISAAAFGSCTATNPISLATNGPATLTLTTPGAHYYICTFRSHCQIGQKLAINVSDSSTTTPPAATPKTPRSPPPPSAILKTPPSPSTTSPSTPPSETPSTPSPPCPPNVSTSSCDTSSPPTTTWDDTAPPPPPPSDSDEASSFTAVVPSTFLIIGLALLNY